MEIISLNTPLLTKHHRQLLQQYSREYRDWAMYHSKRVAGSKDSWFIPQHIDRCIMVRHLPSELLLPLIQYVLHGPVVVILCFGWHSHGPQGPAVVLEQIMKAAGYLDINADTLHCICVPKQRWTLRARQHSMPQGSNCARVVPVVLGT